MNSEIRIGKVSSIDYKKGMMRITYHDKDDSVTMDFSMMNYNDEYRMPDRKSTRLNSSHLIVHT